VVRAELTQTPRHVCRRGERCSRRDESAGEGCRCFGSDRAPGVAPRGAFRSRMVLSTVAQWFVPDARETVDNGL
jgi:hypothetical protein